MTARHMKNSPEKAQLEWVKNSKLFQNRDASISLHTNLTKKKKYQKVTKQKPNKYIGKDFHKRRSKINQY